MNCTLCHAPATFFCEDKKRPYFRCTECDLVFAAPNSYLSDNDEKAIYDFHENDPNDDRYRQFLNQLATPLLGKLSAGMEGLDFGCGPGPVLNLMMEEHGMSMSVYDIYYVPDKNKVARQYDFVTSTEVVEHFYKPSEAWPQLVDLVKRGGWLGIMTSMFTRELPQLFKQWQYKNDPTHVSFYSPKTMHWIAKQFELEIEIVSNRIILFQRR
ncbi:class I SAM-dependent methyltransferase [Idiomarina piscisalsi]|uniref:class I SAM-dependent methyltransferase n=1 Tax=Idiomarina piscisalsi TaxID=1096243 RepID=UPI0013856640|nr:class I SAM-dependent methyltransferase [Idiomarina piscisalsi]MTJ01729.1 class I SAM-dependent methyltransferase [Idiomarina piscisalsi]